MTRRSVLLLSLAIPCLFASPAPAQEPFFYDGTRALSLGKAMTGVSGDENALFYNPAGLARFEGQKVSLSGYIQQYSWWLGYSGPLSGISPNFTDRGFCASYVRGGFGISYGMTGKGWWDHLTFVDSSTIFDPSAEPTTVRPMTYERFLTVSYARSVTPRLSLGVSGRYMHFSLYFDTDRLDDYDGVSFDAGALFLISKKFTIGLNLINIYSTDIDYAVYNDFTTVSFLRELPVNVAAGIAWRPIETLTVTADSRNILEDNVKNAINDLEMEFKRSYHLGLEYRPAAWASVRAGYYFSQRAVEERSPPLPFESPEGNGYEYEKYNAFTAGFGVLYRNVSIDLGLKMDDRNERIEDPYDLELRDTTALGSATVSYSF